MPDSFKGSLSAVEVCKAMEDGIRRAFQGTEEVFQITSCPVADGGEGTVQSIITACGGSIIAETVTGPLGRSVRAEYGLLDEDGSIAVLELAAASGLTLVPSAQLSPFTATTRGTGELIKHALSGNAKRIIIGLGGSATNDGGTGMLSALGIRFIDSDGCLVEEGAKGLKNIHEIDIRQLDPRLEEVEVVIASDVTNPLLGSTGAVYTFSPQKGARAEELPELEEGMAHFADMLEKATGRSIRNAAGAGAAGGTGAGLQAFLPNVKLVSGIDLIMQLYRIHDRLPQTDLLLTGEGKIDEQTIRGKVISGIVRAAKPYDVPVLALAGSVQGDLTPLYEEGLTAAGTVVPGPCTLEEALAHAYDNIANATERWLRMISRSSYSA